MQIKYKVINVIKIAAGDFYVFSKRCVNMHHNCYKYDMRDSSKVFTFKKITLQKYFSSLNKN